MTLSFPSLLAQNVWNPDNGDGTFTNPILWGDWPDPDVIRVGNEFYMSSTSMHYVPGCPILRSKDLVNWSMVGYAVERYDEDPRFDMQGGTLYLNGAWATSLRYHCGKFYLAFCTPKGWGIEDGHFSLCEADRPEGPWRRTIFDEYMYDPGLFFDDDGKGYVVHGQHHLYVTELSDDYHSVKGQPVLIWDKGFANSQTWGTSFGMEGSHMYKVNGYYYITCPAGGTQGWQVCLRSRDIHGPYEHRIIFEDDASYPGNGLHQGGMVQLKNGDWWFVIMQDRGPMGRVPNLLPVKWTDGWPMLGDNGKDAVIYAKPDVGRTYSESSPATSDQFSSATLGLQWQWNHNPDNTRWSLTERKGFMRIRASLARDLTCARNTLTQRVQGPASHGTVKIDVAGLKDGNVAGFGIFELPYAYLAVVQHQGVRELQYCCDGQDNVTLIPNLTTDLLWLRARVTDNGFTARFYYSTDGVTFHDARVTFSMGLGLPWTANRFALFNYSTTEDGVNGYADFDWFRFSGK
ncbi:MAG: glycoside hydrolase 43 family protein [Bacteroidaceae bacterium]